MTWSVRARGKRRLRTPGREPPNRTGTSNRGTLTSLEALAGERVRRELARELHDQVVQELTATLVDLENFKRQPFDGQAVTAQIDVVQDTLRRTLRELRQVLHGLRDEDGWEPGFVESLREFGRRYEERTGVRVQVAVGEDWPARIRVAAAHHLARIINEATSNARLHGGARTVSVSLRLADGGRAVVCVQDDGGGLDPEAPAGHGMVGMRERAALLGGELDVENLPGGGAILRLEVPSGGLA